MFGGTSSALHGASAEWTQWTPAVPVPVTALKAAKRFAAVKRVKLHSSAKFTDLPFDVVRKLLVDHLHPWSMAQMRCVGLWYHGICDGDTWWKHLSSRVLSVPFKEVEAPLSYMQHRPDSGTLDEDEDEPVKFSIGHMDRCQISAGCELSYEDVFTKLLYPFRNLLNKLLCSFSNPWGNLLTIRYDRGLIQAFQWFVPGDITLDMVAVPDFTVFINHQTNEVDVINHLFYSNTFANSQPLRELVFSSFSEHMKTLKLMTTFAFRSGVSVWTEEMSADFELFRAVSGMSWPYDDSFEVPLHGSFSTLAKYTGLLSSALGQQSFLPLKSIGKGGVMVDSVGMLSGCFKGMLGPRGNQLFQWLLVESFWIYRKEMCKVRVSSSSTNSELTGIKLTGDSAVAAGHAAFWFDLSSRICVPPEELDDIDIFSRYWTETMWYRYRIPLGSPSGPQEFRLPAEITVDMPFDINLVPNSCLGRYLGSYQTVSMSAYNGHPPLQRKPVNAQLVVFSLTRFLVIWYSPMCDAVLFEKISEDDPILPFL